MNPRKTSKQYRREQRANKKRKSHKSVIDVPEGHTLVPIAKGYHLADKDGNPIPSNIRVFPKPDEEKVIDESGKEYFLTKIPDSEKEK